MRAALCALVSLACAARADACPADCYCGPLGRYRSVVVCSHSEWTEIPSNLSASLQAVDFSNNRIAALAGDDLRGLRDLVSVELQCNLVREVPEDFFQDAEQLQVVDLSFNSIGSLPRGLFRNNGRLERLYLKRNPLATLSATTPLLSSNALSTLDVSYCGITELWGASFSELSNLKNLNLVGNSITTMRVDVVKPLLKLERIEMFGNELDCKDARFRETVDYLRENSVLIVPYGLCEGTAVSAKLMAKASHGVETTGRTLHSSESDVVTTTGSKEILMGNVSDTMTTRKVAIVEGSVTDAKTTRRSIAMGSMLHGIPLSEVVQASSLLLAALFLIVVAVRLVSLGRGGGRAGKQLPPLGESRSREYAAASGSLHEYAYPALGKQQQQQEESHYSEVSGGDDGYLPPRPPPAAAWAAQPLLARPAYRETTVPVPDVVGQAGAAYVAHSFFLRPPPPRPSFWA
ncbi:leucine-rich repeat-containing G-protein coupled receptor 5-like isoform X2 [Bacillus rossius redtenbacheri]